MRFFALIAICVCSFNIASAQDSTSVERPLINMSGVEVKPEFPGGIDQFYKYIQKHYKKPKAADGHSGRVFVTFVIERDGAVADIKVLRDIGFGTAEEAIRVLEKCPKWKPGEQNGRTVRVQYSLPIVL
jgi:protein TonB